MHWLNVLISALTHEPVEQLDCAHPPYARDYRLTLMGEQEARMYYEVCLNCKKVFDNDE